MGAPVQTVIDVGVLTGTYELKAAFGDTKQVLIEPIVEWSDTINAAYGDAGVDFDLVSAAASDFDGAMNIRLSSVSTDQKITHARLSKEKFGPDELNREVDVVRIDTLVRARGYAPNYLVKIDVDGAELDVWRGCGDIVDEISVVIMEVQIKNFVERMNAVTQKGFHMFDIVDFCYYGDELRQMDLVFLNSAIADAHGLQSAHEKFDVQKWFAYAPGD